MSLILPKAVVFDWDNTLVDSWERIQKCMNAVLVEFDQPTWTLEDTKQRAHRSLNDSFPEAFGDRWHEAKAIFYKHCHALSEDLISPIHQAEEVLDLLKSKGVELGIASNKTSNYLHHEVDGLGWRKYFGDAVVGSAEAAKDKPFPDPVFKALEEHSVCPKENHVWYIGDTCTDMICAQNASCRPILYGDKLAAPKIGVLDIDHHHVNNHAELIKLISGLK